MRKLLKWIGTLIVVVVPAALMAFGLAWLKTERAMAKTYTVSDPPLTLPSDAAALAHGRHLFVTRGCDECHGSDGAGRLVFDAGPVIKLVAPNITSGGVTKGLTADQIAASIRHGVKPDGRPMVFMPTPDFNELSDADTAALIAYLQTLPASANRPGALEIRPLGRLMYAFGNFPLLPAEDVDHSPRARVAPPAGATAAYGEYLAKACIGCHGAALAGQHVPGTPPEFPDAKNLTPSGLGAWTEADFRRALREGKRPDGSAIDPFMPWKALSTMSDEEISAVWAYLQTLPPAASKKS
jgi:mono/diheme cytochrome c family protein